MAISIFSIKCWQNISAIDEELCEYYNMYCVMVKGSETKTSANQKGVPMWQRLHKSSQICLTTLIARPVPKCLQQVHL